MNKKYLLAAILATAVSSNAFAGEKKNEISAFVYANKQIDPAGQDPMVTVYASYGRFLTERIGITGSVNVTKAGGFTLGGVGIGGKYYFKVGQKGDFVPFVVAELQFGLGGDASTDIYYTNLAGGGGASLFITETASIDGRLVYQVGSQSVTTYTGFGTYDSTVSTSALFLTLGLTQRF